MTTGAPAEVSCICLVHHGEAQSCTLEGVEGCTECTYHSVGVACRDNKEDVRYMDGELVMHQSPSASAVGSGPSVRVRDVSTTTTTDEIHAPSDIAATRVAELCNADNRLLLKASLQLQY